MQYNWAKIEFLCYARVERARLQRKHPYAYYMWDFIGG